MRELTPKSKAKSSIYFDKLLSEQDINKVKDRFNSDVDMLLEEAIKKHHNIADGGTPMWLYLILFYVAYDDILRMMWNPFLFTPIMLIISGIGFMYSMGLGPVIIPMGRTTVNGVLSSYGVPLRI